MMHTDYTVVGMTCDHCVASVTEETREIPGVRAVAVDLGSGRLTLTSTDPLDPDAVRDAVAEAGYSLG